MTLKHYAKLLQPAAWAMPVTFLRFLIAFLPISLERLLTEKSNCVSGHRMSLDWTGLSLWRDIVCWCGICYIQLHFANNFFANGRFGLPTWFCLWCCVIYVGGESLANSQQTDTSIWDQFQLPLQATFFQVMSCEYSFQSFNSTVENNQFGECINSRLIGFSV